MTTPIPQQWLPGWFYFPTDTHTRFAGRRAEATAWTDAATWLRQELYEGFSEWGALPVESMHRARTAPYAILSFPDCRAFADEVLPLRQHQGVWGSDGQRCFYIIRDDLPTTWEKSPPPPSAPAAHDTAPLAAVH